MRILLIGVALLLCGQAHGMDIKVHRYVSLAGWYANSYWIETKTGVIVIDAPLLKSDARRLAGNLKASNKPVVGALITHPHPDHFGGLPVLQDVLGAFPVYATAQTAEHLAAELKHYLQHYASTFGVDAETRLPGVDHILKPQQRLTLAGVRLHVDDLGPGESHNNTVFYLPEHQWLFSGDASMHGSHYFIGEGRSARVLRQFEHMLVRYQKAQRVYSGHGEPAGIDILRQHRDYVERVRAKVKAALDKAEPTDARKPLEAAVVKRLAREICAEFPYLGSYGFAAEGIAAMNVQGVAREWMKHQG